MKMSIEQKSIPTVRFDSLVAGDLFIYPRDSNMIRIKTDSCCGVALINGETCFHYEPGHLVTNVTDQFELTRTAEYLE
jgi:hypothetical protein